MKKTSKIVAIIGIIVVALVILLWSFMPKVHDVDSSLEEISNTDLPGNIVYGTGDFNSEKVEEIKTGDYVNLKNDPYIIKYQNTGTYSHINGYQNNGDNKELYYSIVPENSTSGKEILVYNKQMTFYRAYDFNKNFKIRDINSATWTGKGLFVKTFSDVERNNKYYSIDLDKPIGSEVVELNSHEIKSFDYGFLIGDPFKKGIVISAGCSESGRGFLTDAATSCKKYSVSLIDTVHNVYKKLLTSSSGYSIGFDENSAYIIIANGIKVFRLSI